MYSMYIISIYIYIYTNPIKYIMIGRLMLIATNLSGELIKSSLKLQSGIKPTHYIRFPKVLNGNLNDISDKLGKF